jgi:hypothetical protein
MNCPGSLRAEAEAKELHGDPQNVYGALGTAAHHLAAHCLANGAESAYEYLGRVISIVDGDACWPHQVPSGAAPEFSFEVDQDMVEGVDLYLRTVQCVREELSGDDEEIEVTMDMSWLHPDMGGTADYLKAEPFGLLVVIDYKNGQVHVEVRDNPQLKKYAVGALHRRPDCDRVRIVIVQPNSPHTEGLVRKVEYTRAEIDAFAGELLTAAVRTEDEDAPRTAGSWCDWCAALPDCEEARAQVMRQTGADFDDDPEELAPPDDADLGRALTWVPTVDAWCRAVSARGQQMLEAGKAVAQHKLVAGRGSRDWVEKDEAKLTRRLLAMAKKLGGPVKIAKADLYSAPKLKSPHAVETIGVRGLKRAIRDAAMFQSFPGRPTMAHEDDPRPAITPSCVSDFEEDAVED